MNFNDLMRAPEPVPNRMEPAEGGAGVDAAAKWQDAISGRAPQFTGLQDTKAAADSWFKQPFTTQSERDARAKLAQTPATGVSHDEGPEQSVEEAQAAGKRLLRRVGAGI